MVSCAKVAAHRSALKDSQRKRSKDLRQATADRFFRDRIRSQNREADDLGGKARTLEAIEETLLASLARTQNAEQ